MGSKRLFSSSSELEASSFVEDKRGKKLKGVAGGGLDSGGGPDEKGDCLESMDILESIKDDPGRIEEMTVQVLRTTLRRIGIPAKGRKPDLISALKSYVKERINDVNGLQRSQKKIKRAPQGKVGSSLVISQKMESIEAVKITGKTMSSSPKKVTREVSVEEVGGSHVVDKKLDQSEPWTILAHKKPQKHWVAYNPRTMRSPPVVGKTNCVRMLSWNVNGLKSLLKNQMFSAIKLAQREDIDVLCFQETKLQEKDIEAVKDILEGYDHSFWTCSMSKLGYSGTAIISRIKPLSVRYGLGIADHDNEGRLITAEFDSFYLLSTYVPNSGDGLKRLPYRITEWDPSLGRYLKELEKSKPVILTGDLNCAHQEIDIHDPAGNKRSAGFTIEERQSFETNFLSKGFVDTFRRQHPDTVGYTYWGYRHGLRKTNKGWRLDYFLVSESIADNVHDSYILPDVTGSDHSPVGLILKL